MANAVITTFGQHISAGSTAISDNSATALDIETTAGEDLITVDTTTSQESIHFLPMYDSSSTAGRGVKIPNGSASYPGIYFPTAQRPGFACGGEGSNVHFVYNGNNIIRFNQGQISAGSIGNSWNLAIEATSSTNPVYCYGHSNMDTGIGFSSGPKVHLIVDGANRFECDQNGNIGLGGPSYGTSAAGVFAIANGTAPASSPANAVQLYAEDVTSSSELKVRDEAGNITTLSPHHFTMIERSEPMAWSYYSCNPFVGKEINIDMMRVVRKVEELSGEKFIVSSPLPPDQCLDWDTEEQRKYDDTQAAIVDYAAMDEDNQEVNVEPIPYTKKPKPSWLA